MRIILTGAGGFLGRGLLERLRDAETEVCALTSQAEDLALRFQGSGNLSFLPGDALLTGALRISQGDILVNCAFPRLASGAPFAQGLRYLRDSLRAAANQGVGGVINISSQSVYSQVRECAATEETEAAPENMYAVGKYAAELMTESVCAGHCPCTHVRLASLIGPGFDQRVTNKLVEKARLEGRLVVQNSLQQFGFLDIEDAVSGILGLVALPPERWRPVYNLGAEGTYSLPEIARTVAAVCRAELGREIVVDVTEGDAVLNTALDCTLLQFDTGYRQRVSLEESIVRILRRQLGA